MKNPLQRISNTFRLTLNAFILLLLPSLSFGQTQYWNTEITSLNLTPIPLGFLEVDQNNVYSLISNTMQGYDFFGTDQGNGFSPSNSGNLKSTFYFERRSDLTLVGEIHQITDNMQMTAFDPETDQSFYVVDFQGDSDSPEDAVPLGFKGVGDDEYYMIDDVFIHRFQINGSAGYDEVYNIEHGGNIFTSAFVKGNNIYLTASTGDIYTLGSSGELTEVATLEAKLNTALVLSDGLLIGGEKDGENFVIKTDNAFVEQWSNTYGEKDCRKIYASTNDGYLLTGESTDGTGYLQKITAAGNAVWKSSQMLVPGVAIIENAVGNIFVSGRTKQSGGINQITKLGPNGEEGPTIDSENGSQFKLSANNINASISNSGDLFFDGNDGLYNFPAGAPTTTFSTGNLWIGGLDPGANLKFSGNSYGATNGFSDFDMGPIDAEDPKFFERVWSISQSDIEAIRNDLVDGTQNLDWSPDIVDWPAKGNTIPSSDGELLLIENDLAPFVDVNNDGEYHVEDGDYPKIKGDEMAWWIMNDDRLHASSGGQQLNIEVIATFYAVGCDEDHISFNTTFLDYEITNKGTEGFQELSAGLWLDPDIGCYTDDYIGCIPDQNSAIIYNQDAVDGTNGTVCDGGIPTFGETPPLQSVVSLNRSLDNFIYFNNGGIGNPNPGTTDPGNAQEAYNYLTGKWRDGTPISIGGDGYDPGNANITNFTYPGNPSDPNDWSMCSANSAEQDRRIVMSSKIDAFDPGQTITLKYAFITSTDIDYPCPTLENVKTDIETIQAMNDDFANLHFDLGPNQNLQDQDPITLDPGAGGVSYTWSTGAITQTISVTTPGTYTVSITNAVGCEIIEEITIDLTDGLQNIEAQLLNIYPNPTSQYFTIDLPLDAAMLDISVLSIDGKLMLQKNNLIKGIGKYDIDASNWSSGIYFIKINSERGTHIGKVSVLR